MRWGNSDREVDRVGVFGCSLGEEGVSCRRSSSRACRRVAKWNDVHGHCAHTIAGWTWRRVVEVRTCRVTSTVCRFICPGHATHVETTGWFGAVDRGPAEFSHLQNQARATTSRGAEAREMRGECDHEPRGDVAHTCVDHRLIPLSTTPQWVYGALRDS
jgi:hypothetical protein